MNNKSQKNVIRSLFFSSLNDLNHRLSVFHSILVTSSTRFSASTYISVPFYRIARTCLFSLRNRIRIALSSLTRSCCFSTFVGLLVLGGIGVYEKRHSCNDSAVEKKDKASAEASGTDRRQTNGRNIIRRSSERRIYRSRSNGWRGCDSNPLSLGLTPSPLPSLLTSPSSAPSPFCSDLTFSPQFTPSLLLKRLKRLAVPDVCNLLELSENYNTKSPA